MTCHDPRQCDMLAMLDRPPEPPKKPATPRRSKPPRAAPPPATVIGDPQLPARGAFAKINGRWHYWDANDSLSGSRYGWELCKPYWSRAHLADTPPILDCGNTQPKGWIKAAKGADRTVIVAGREFTCRPDEPDPVLTEIRGIPCVVSFHYGFGTHAIDRDKPFWSESGFRGFEPIVASVEEVIALVEAYIDTPRNPKGYGMGAGGCGGELMPWREWTPGSGNGRFIPTSEQPKSNGEI